MAKDKRLGRGLEALLNRVSVASTAADKVALPQVSPNGAGKSGGGNEAEAAVGQSAAPVHKSPIWEAAIPETAAARDSAVGQATTVPEIRSIKTVRTDSDFPTTTNSANTANSSNAANEQENNVEDDTQTDTVYYLDINEIDANPYQPRLDFDSDEINQLADSLNAHGLLQALVVRQKTDGRYELVCGERRLRAALQVGWQQIPAVVIEATDREMAELSLVENLQRKDLNAIEKAISFDNYLKERKCTQEELSKRLCLDRSTIANLIRLLDLPESIQQMVQNNDLSGTHARALLPLGDEKLQQDFAQRIVREHLSAHEVEDMVRDFLEKEDRGAGQELVNPTPQKPVHSEKHLAELEKEFLMKTGMKIKLSQSAGGKGKMTINFKNHDQFELLQSILMSADYPVTEKEARKKAA